MRQGGGCGSGVKGTAAPDPRGPQAMEQLTDHRYETLTLADDPAANCLFVRLGTGSAALVHRSPEECPGGLQVGSTNENGRVGQGRPMGTEQQAGSASWDGVVQARKARGTEEGVLHQPLRDGGVIAQWGWRDGGGIGQWGVEARSANAGGGGIEQLGRGWGQSQVMGMEVRSTNEGRGGVGLSQLGEMGGWPVGREGWRRDQQIGVENWGSH